MFSDDLKTHQQISSTVSVDISTITGWFSTLITDITSVKYSKII